MFEKFKKNGPHPIDQPINRILDEMEVHGPDSPEYPDFIDYLTKLTELKIKDQKPKISGDTMAVVFGNLAGILLIVAYEQKHVITSKAMQFSLRTNPQINQ